MGRKKRKFVAPTEEEFKKAAESNVNVKPPKKGKEKTQTQVNCPMVDDK